MENFKRKFPPNPRDSAKGIFSIVFFWWTIPIFRKSNNRTLGIDDVVQPRKVDQSELLGHRLERFVAPRSTMEDKFWNIPLADAININESVLISIRWHGPSPERSGRSSQPWQSFIHSSSLNVQRNHNCLECYFYISGNEQSNVASRSNFISFLFVEMKPMWHATMRWCMQAWWQFCLSWLPSSPHITSTNAFASVPWYASLFVIWSTKKPFVYPKQHYMIRHLANWWICCPTMSADSIPPRYQCIFCGCRHCSHCGHCIAFGMKSDGLLSSVCLPWHWLWSRKVFEWNQNC